MLFIFSTLLIGCGGGVSETTKQNEKPNIIFILTDDFSMNLLKYMTSSPYGGISSMMNEGTTFNNHFVSNSLCCPSRSSIFTGKLPHNTSVFTNTYDPINGLTDGGFGAFTYNSPENPIHTFAVALRQSGYTTAMLGKYLNGYSTKETAIYNAEQLWKTTWGWDNWYVGDNGYPEFNYDLNENGKVVPYGFDSSSYMTDVLSTKAQNIITSTSKPFFIEISTFSPHGPFTPAPRDSNAYPNAAVPKTVLYGARPDTNAPLWLQKIPALTTNQKDTMDKKFRLRAQSVLAIDKMISDIRATLKATNKEKNTYIIFSADNGFHMGEYSLMPGKMTPFDMDTNTPLIIIGPDVIKQQVNAIVQNIDLCPTFADLGKANTSINPDGKSLVPWLRGNIVSKWRSMALIEHHGPPDDINDLDMDEDVKSTSFANPPNYAAIRTANYLYVEYFNDGVNVSEYAYYDIRAGHDPEQLKNIYSTLSTQQRTELHAQLVQNKNCGKVGKLSCWEAQQ